LIEQLTVELKGGWPQVAGVWLKVWQNVQGSSFDESQPLER